MPSTSGQHVKAAALPAQSRRSLVRLTIGAVALVASVSACGDDDSSGTGPTVEIDDVGHGPSLVTGGGRALYMFEPDQRRESTCYGSCAKIWPPLLVDAAPTPGESIDGALLGTTTRDDGRLQVTYGGWPLYTYLPDSKGIATGQGIDDSGGLWYLVAPDGSVID